MNYAALMAGFASRISPSVSPRFIHPNLLELYPWMALIPLRVIITYEKYF